RIGARDFAGAMRAAHHMDDDAIAIVKACIAVAGNETKASDLLSDVPTDARRDLGYTLCRVDWMMRHDRIADAAHLVLAADGRRRRSGRGASSSPLGTACSPGPCEHRL